MNKISIRRYQYGDEEELYHLVTSSLTHLKPWMPWAEGSYSKNDTKLWIAQCISDWENASAFRYLVVDKNSDIIMGATGLERINQHHRIAELGYWIGHNYTNRGIISVAARQTVQNAFNEHNLNRVEINILQDNISSNRVATKIGARFEGAFRNKLFHNGQSQVANCYSLIPQDYHHEAVKTDLNKGETR